VPRASLVAAGDEYVADVYIASGLSGQSPDMFYNGQKITVVEDPITKIKKGQIRFPTTAETYDASGRSIQSFKTSLTVQGKTYENVVEYTVVRPVIRISSGNVPQLYLNCGNTVNIEVPALGTFYNPTFSAAGARIFTSERPGRIIIVPSDMKVTLTVMNEGKILGTEIFDVKRLPRPIIICRDANGQEINLKAGVRLSTLSLLRVSIEPDENFRASVPRDAVYRVRAMEVSLRRGVNFLNTMTVNSENVDLSAWRAILRPDDMIVCNIKTAVRVNYLGEDQIIDVAPDNYQLIPVR
jgi:gliding motility-associated protein GldM